jgi:glutamine amidotransferase
VAAPSPPITILDCGLGNLGSVSHALQRAGAAARISADPREVARSERLVFPGQGAFRDCAAAMAGPLGEAVRGFLATERPYLGICLGMQVLFEESLEGGVFQGLGLLRGRVERLVPRPGEKVPHIGWNQVSRTAGAAGFALRVPEGERFYFVHSYRAVAEATDVSLTCDYGAEPLAAAVSRGSAFACQFHPEKSQRAGLHLLETWLAS